MVKQWKLFNSKKVPPYTQDRGLTPDIGEKLDRFRILIVGRASAGKTTLLQRLCNTTENLEIVNQDGNEIDAVVVKTSINRRHQNIEDELVFKSCPDFVFHECGFEAGDEKQFKKMMKFVSERSSSTRLNEQIRAIWYCIPMDEYNRAIMKAEREFFTECDTRTIPVIAVFTKFDALYDDAYEQLKELGFTRRESSEKAPERAKEIFTNAGIWDQLRKYQYPPKDFACLAEMDKEGADCGPLLEVMCNGQLFSSHLDSLWQTANRNWCDALLRRDRVIAAISSYRYMVDKVDEAVRTNCLEWSTTFKQDCIARCVAKGEEAAAKREYERAIALYSAAIGLDSSSDCSLFALRSTAKFNGALYTEAIIDAKKVVELNPSSYVGYELKYIAFHGAERYEEATEAFKTMLSTLGDSPDAQKVREKYISPSDEHVIRAAVREALQNTPQRLLDTSTGLLCDREAQIHAFMMSEGYREFLALNLKHARISTGPIPGAVQTYFCYVMLSHRWEGKEPLLRDIQDKIVYDTEDGSIAKLRSFCETARNAGFRWAWIDTCCIDQSNNVELQESVNSMFTWYRYSELTIIYLSDVAPSSKPGALAKSAWNTRGWTVQEFLAPRFVLFYQQNWTLYLDDRTPNHKDSLTIMQELGDATGINARALTAFQPGMRDAREKLRWASTRATTHQEDIAYSLFGIFGIHLPVIYGERKQNALGRLLQEIVARSGDITALDWVGKPSEFNSCLPADITSYTASPRPRTLLALSDNDIEVPVCSLRNAGVVESASTLYTLLDNLSAPRFAYSRLQLPCIAFSITEVKWKWNCHPCFTYGVKVDGLQDLLITTEDRLPQFSPAWPAQQTFLLVRPWNRYDLGLPDFADDTQSVANWPKPMSPVDNSQGAEDRLEPESPSGDPPRESSGVNDLGTRALKLIARLGKPFSALLLAQQRAGEYKRIASDHEIIAEVEDKTSVLPFGDIRTLEIL